MRFYSRIFMAVVAAGCATGIAFAAGAPAAQKTTAPPAAASGTATQSQKIAAPAPAPAVKVVSGPVALDVADLVSKVKAAYGDPESYELRFDLATDMGKKEVSSERIKQLTNTYNLKYARKGAAPEEYLLRLEGVNGLNRKTTVIYSPDKNGEYSYTVYKPALPRGKKVGASSPLVSDVPESRIGSFLELLDALSKTSDASKEIGDEFKEYPFAYAKKNVYVFEAVSLVDPMLMRVDPKNPLVKNIKTQIEKDIVTIDAKTYRIISWEKRIKKNERGEFLFRSLLTWKEYSAGGTTEAEIMAKPHFNSKEQR